jgi:glycosyltransferase involved in cell wall biosynthesis
MEMSADSPLVSVVIPVRNGERFIGRTLASVAAQTYSPLEIVVVNDGSTDRTAAIIEAAARRDARIRLYSIAASGLPATRNFGIKQSRGSLIAPLDADDLWHPEKIARQVAIMQSSPNVGVVYCWTIDIDEFDFVIPPVRAKSDAEGNVIATIAANNGIEGSGSTHLIRRSCLDACGGYDPDQILGAEDWKLNFLLAEICDFAVVRSHLVGYRRTAGSMTRNVSAMENGMGLVAQWIMTRSPDLPPETTRRMVYNMNAFLAHASLTNNQFANAIRYKMKSLRVRPVSLLYLSNVTFALRFTARLFGFKRTGRREKFEQFCGVDGAGTRDRDVQGATVNTACP